jgi:hypothetical protein
MAVLKALARSRKFWLAIFAVVQSVVFGLWPDFPVEIWVAIDALVVVLINAIAHEDAAEKGALAIVAKATPPECPPEA